MNILLEAFHSVLRKDLRESFEAYGAVDSVITDKFTGRSKGLVLLK
jgi:hypothetical protein